MSQRTAHSDISRRDTLPVSERDEIGQTPQTLHFGDLDFTHPDYRRYLTGRLPVYWIEGRGQSSSSQKYTEFVDAHTALLEATSYSSIRKLHQKSAALFHQYAESEGVAATLVDHGSFLRVRIEPEGRSHLNWYADLVVRSGGSGVYFDPARIRTLNGAAGAYLPRHREILLGGKGVQNFHTLNSTRLHELLHLRNDMLLLRGVETPYQGAFLSHSKRDRFTEDSDQNTATSSYGVALALDETQVRDLVFCYLKNTLTHSQGDWHDLGIVKELLQLTIDGLALAQGKKRLFEMVLKDRPPLLPATPQLNSSHVPYRECSLNISTAPRATLCLPLPGIEGAPEQAILSAFYDKAQRSYDAAVQESEVFEERFDICSALVELGKKKRISYGFTPLFNHGTPETVAAYKEYSGNTNPTRSEILSGIVRTMTGLMLSAELSQDEQGCTYRSQYSQGKILLSEAIDIDQRGRVTRFFTKGLLARARK